jgi:hypothetical protein
MPSMNALEEGRGRHARTDSRNSGDHEGRSRTARNALPDVAVSRKGSHVIPKRLLGERIGTLGPSRVCEVKGALGYALDWAELKVVKA